MNPSFRKIIDAGRLRLAKVLILGAMLGTSFGAYAVTDSEMDHARAIAAKFYVRYINDGAGYLDNWLPTSMAELEKKVSNRTDKENLKAFKAAAYPTDYASWDKEKLAAYWGGQFFTDNATALNSKAAGNAMCKKQIKKAVEGIKIEAPVAQAEPAAPAAPEQPEEIAGVADAELAPIDAAEVQEMADMEAAQAEVAQEGARAGESAGDSGTWVYIMVLGILVAIVIGLVIFASRTMKKQPAQTGRDEEEEEDETPAVETPVNAVVSPSPSAPASAPADDTKMREKYARTLASKSEEIRTLTRQLTEMEGLAARLKEENRKLTAEVERLRNHAAYQPVPAEPRQAPEPRHHEPRVQKQQQHQQGDPTQGAPAKEVYLGRVNSKGLFVRADRHAVDGQSIYKLTTSNGVTGTYALINNPLIIDQVLEDPGKWLAGGCFAKDIFDTDGRENILTETPGKAVFSEGAWRVEKKSKIRYE